MENEKVKCSLSKHKENVAISFCQECKLNLCNKCEKHHSELFENHHQCKLDKDFSEIFTGLCKEQNHFNKLEFFCEDHNKLCCASCVTKIKYKIYGQHADCKIFLIENIKEEKQNKLNQNIKILEELSKSFDESYNKLKIIFEKINQNKEDLKLKIQKIFTNIRNALNEREDKILLDIDKQFDDLYIKEDLIKQSEKLPKKIKDSLEKGKHIDKEWNDKDKLSSLINECLIIEDNIKNINILNEKVNEFNSMDLDFEFSLNDEEVNNFIENIKNFGNINYNVNSLFKFEWENHFDCEFSNNNKKLKKIKNEGWKTNIKGNKILKKSSINIFKIKVNKIKYDKSGLAFGIAKASSNFSTSLYDKDWHINCANTKSYNSKFKSFISTTIDQGDIVTFIVDLIKGTLSVKKNDEILGTINNIPINEDLVPCVCNYYIENEVEIVE